MEGKLLEIKKHLKTAISLLESLEGAEGATSEPTTLESTTSEPATFKQMGFLKGQLAKGIITEISPDITKKQAWELIRKIKAGERI